MVEERHARGYYTCTGCIQTEMDVKDNQRTRRKQGKPATRAGGGGSKKGDVGGRKKRDGNGKRGGPPGAAGGVLGGRVQKAA
ncbi:hypothetical protein N0V85_008006 [Neurospora sp. IMI 360204]|nr:hypothetical protein N0V85_008006 [Neurospora sp. IMI 360204]